MLLPSSGLTRPDVFQSNWAAGTSVVVRLEARLSADLVGSSGVQPRLAANRGIELFHLPPWSLDDEQRKLVNLFFFVSCVEIKLKSE